MRELKFRAWDTTSNKMYSQFDIEEYSLEQLNRISKGNDYTKFMQYTGLKDKSGKEIYEGDIVSLDFFEPYDNDCIYVDDLSGEILTKVEFNNGGWFCSRENSTWFHLYDVSDYCDIQIIGNIRENPELLDLSAS